MKLERALAQIEKDVPECVGIAYIDTTMALLVGVRTVDSHPTEVLDLVAETTSRLFADERLSAVDRSSVPGDPEVKSIVMLSASLIHVFFRGVRFPSHVLVLVCRASANLGMVLVRGRDALVRAESAI